MSESELNVVLSGSLQTASEGTRLPYLSDEVLGYLQRLKAQIMRVESLSTI